MPFRSASKKIPSLSRHFNTHAAKPSFVMGLGTADQPLAYTHLSQRAHVTFMKEKLITSYLGQDGMEALPKMSPRELSDLANTVVDDFAMNGYILPGSNNTIPTFLWKKDEAMPKSLNVSSARSLFKMALSRKLSLEKTPSLYSCDGSNYLIILLGGELSYSSEAHLGSSHPLIFTKQPNWLSDVLKKKDPYKISDDIMVTSAVSTHPLTPTHMPKSAKILAAAPDGSPSITLFQDVNAISLTDHIEARDLFEISHYEELKEEFLQYKKQRGETINLDHLTFLHSENVWDAIIKSFCNAMEKYDEAKKASPSPQTNAKSVTKFDSRIEEILDTKDVKKWSNQSIPISSKSR